MAESQAESFFVYWWQQINTLEPEFALVKEFRFDPTRKWRFDFAFPDAKVAIEIEGGVYTNGRHSRGKGFENDCEKYNRATELGWRILRYTPQMIGSDAVSVIRQVENVLKEFGYVNDD